MLGQDWIIDTEVWFFLSGWHHSKLSLTWKQCHLLASVSHWAHICVATYDLGLYIDQRNASWTRTGAGACLLGHYNILITCLCSVTTGVCSVLYLTRTSTQSVNQIFLCIRIFGWKYSTLISRALFCQKPYAIKETLNPFHLQRNMNRTIKSFNKLHIFLQIRKCIFCLHQV